MPITVLDPRTALILIDLQRGIVSLPSAHPSGEIIARAATLAEAFRKHNLPVVLVNVDRGAPGRTNRGFNARDLPPGWTELVPELNQQPSDRRVTKHTWGAFTGTDLEAYLREKNVTQVVIAGVSTSAGVESTARHAHELGFHVTLATDAMTDGSLDAHTNSIERIFPRIGETGTTQDVLDWLERRSV